MSRSLSENYTNERGRSVLTLSLLNPAKIVKLYYLYLTYTVYYSDIIVNFRIHISQSVT